MATSDPIAEIIGDSRAFAAMQRDRLSARSATSPSALPIGIRGAFVPVLVVAGVLSVASCGGDGNNPTDTSAASTTARPGEPIVIRTRMVIAAEEGAEPIATGDVLEGSTLGSSPFCAGGTIVDSHAGDDPTVSPYGLIDRTISCEDGTMRMGFTPEVARQGRTQAGSWTIVSGTGAFEGRRGTGEMEIVNDPDDESVGRETLTGTVTG